MRKKYKKKKRSCAMCKPHKMGWDKRWNFKEEMKIKESEDEIKNILGRIEKED